MTAIADLADQLGESAAKLQLEAERLDLREREIEELPRAIRAHHDRHHRDAWVVCPHPVCRAAQ